MHQSFGFYSISYLHRMPDVLGDPWGQTVGELLYQNKSLLCVCMCAIKPKLETLDSIQKHNVLCVHPTVSQAYLPPCSLLVFVFERDCVHLFQINILAFFPTLYLYVCVCLLQFCVIRAPK